MIVYIDVFFAINFFMDLVILLTTRRITSHSTKTVRCIPAAITGAIYACFVLIQGIGNGIIEGMFTYIVMSILMSLIAFGYRGTQKMVETITIIFLVTFFMSGIINQLYYRGIIRDIKGIAVCAIIGAVAIISVFNVVKKKSNLGKIFVKTKIVKGEKEVVIKALIDTGNCLREPLSRKPVAVISKEVAEKLKEGDDEGIFVIPYKSVGMEHGILTGFMADYLEITEEKSNGAEVRKIIKPILAEYAGKFTENNHYGMLLHPQMMEEGEVNVCKSSDGK